MEYLEHTDAVLAVARRLAEQLGGWLAASQLAVRKITLSLEHERGRRARPPTELELALSQPAWQPAQILGLLREAGPHDADRPGHRRGPAGARDRGPARRQRHAVSRTGGTAEDQARLLDLLSARLGRERVRRAGPRPTTGPKPPMPGATRCKRAAGAEPLPALLDRPFWLLDPPQPLRLAGDRPQYRGQALRLMRGPEAHRERLVGSAADRARLLRRRGRSRRALLDLPRARRRARALVPARAVRLTPVAAPPHRYPIMRPPDDPADARNSWPCCPATPSCTARAISRSCKAPRIRKSWPLAPPSWATPPWPSPTSAAWPAWCARTWRPKLNLPLLIGACFSCAPRRRRAAGLTLLARRRARATATCPS